MSNDTFSTNPQIQQYLRHKENNLRSKYFKKYKFLNQELSLIMLFQNQAMKHIRDKYGITNTDFKVLSACRIYRLTYRLSFSPYQLRKYLKGVWSEQIYKSFRRLEQRGLIVSYKGKGFKRYTISPEGESCLKSYARVFDEVFYRNIEELE